MVFDALVGVGGWATLHGQDPFVESVGWVEAKIRVGVDGGLRIFSKAAENIVFDFVEVVVG